MNILLLISFLTGLFGLFDQLTGDKTTWKICFLSFAMFVGFLPIPFTLYDFLYSPMSKKKKLTVAWYKLIYSNDYKRELFKGEDSLYCNPITCDSSVCFHKRLIYLREGMKNKNKFKIPKEENKQKIILHCFDNKLNDYIKDQSIKCIKGAYSTNSYVNFTSEEIRGIVNRFNELKVTRSFRFNGVGIWLYFKKDSLKGSYLKIERRNNYNGIEKICKIEYDIKSYLKLLDLFNYLVYSDRSCCFIIDHNEIYKSKLGLRFHSLSLKNVAEKIKLNHKFYLSKKIKVRKVIEGVGESIENTLSTPLSLKFGTSFTTFITKYVKNFYEEKCYELLGFISAKESAKKRFYELSINPKKNLHILNNWQWKRFCVDISYIREKFGFPCLYGIDKSINPTKKCLNYCSKNSQHIIRDNSTYILHKYIPVQFSKKGDIELPDQNEIKDVFPNEDKSDISKGISIVNNLIRQQAYDRLERIKRLQLDRVKFKNKPEELQNLPHVTTTSYVCRESTGVKSYKDSVTADFLDKVTKYNEPKKRGLRVIKQFIDYKKSKMECLMNNEKKEILQIKEVISNSQQKREWANVKKGFKPEGKLMSKLNKSLIRLSNKFEILSKMEDDCLNKSKPIRIEESLEILNGISNSFKKNLTPNGEKYNNLRKKEEKSIATIKKHAVLFNSIKKNMLKKEEERGLISVIKGPKLILNDNNLLKVLNRKNIYLNKEISYCCKKTLIEMKNIKKFLKKVNKEKEKAEEKEKEKEKEREKERELKKEEKKEKGKEEKEIDLKKDKITEKEKTINTTVSPLTQTRIDNISKKLRDENLILDKTRLRLNSEEKIKKDFERILDRKKKFCGSSDEYVLMKVLFTDESFSQPDEEPWGDKSAKGFFNFYNLFWSRLDSKGKTVFNSHKGKMSQKAVVEYLYDLGGIEFVFEAVKIYGVFQELNKYNCYKSLYDYANRNNYKEFK